MDCACADRMSDRSAVPDRRKRLEDGCGQGGAPQYRLARHIPEGATLLNYGFLDGGFYFASGSEPSCRFFCQLNIALEEMYAEQIRQLREGIPDYVVTRQKTLGDYGLEEGYAPVDSAGADYGEGMFAYYLYRREDRNE